MRTKPKTKKPPKPTRHRFILKSLVKQLAKDVDGFKNEAEQIQSGLAYLVWIGLTKARQHGVHEGYMSFHYTELAAACGSRLKWNAVNARLGFLEEKKAIGKQNWRFRAKGKNPKAKATDVHTKPYRFSPTVQASRDTFMAKEPERNKELTLLLDAKGKGIRTPPEAIASQDSAGATTNRWRAINKAGSLRLVPVNIDSLQQFRKRIGKDADTWKRTGQPPQQDLFMVYPNLDTLLELQEKVTQIIHMALTTMGRGYVMHLYKESDSGRLYAQGGVSLCGVPREFRKAALVGLWDYDVKNCHFDIIAQMAKGIGVHCGAIENYLDNKEDVRKEIADTIGISYDETKTCLLSVMYGAKSEAWYWYKNAIPDNIGEDAARRLNDLPLFADIANDVKRARQAILAHVRQGGLAHAKLNRQGGLVNAFEKSIKMDEHSDEQALAHLIQGIEAKALEACTELHPDEIVLLQHDGFTATKQLDVAALEQAIKAATGYALEFEEEQVSPDLAKQYGKAVETEFSKARKSRKAKTGAGFGHIHTPKNTVNSAVPPLCPSLPPPPPCLP